jgi:hypothetical protein
MRNVSIYLWAGVMIVAVLPFAFVASSAFFGPRDGREL